MVVKPLDFITRGSRGIAQPAVKCRGREYLRIIYGPEYGSMPVVANVGCATVVAASAPLARHLVMPAVRRCRPQRSC
jgi:hypothetical protein